MSAAEWIAKRRTALGLLSAYEGLREMAGALTAAVAVGSLGIRGADITAAEDDARTSLPRALDALEAVLAQASPAWAEDWFRIRLTDAVPVWGAMDRLRAAFGTVLELSFARHELLDAPAMGDGRPADDPLALLDAFFRRPPR